jgi:hypothetical protein
MVGLGGLEPPTSRLSSARSNQLSYKPVVEYMFYNQLKAAMQAVFKKCVQLFFFTHYTSAASAGLLASD